MLQEIKEGTILSPGDNVRAKQRPERIGLVITFNDLDGSVLVSWSPGNMEPLHESVLERAYVLNG